MEHGRTNGQWFVSTGKRRGKTRRAANYGASAKGEGEATDVKRVHECHYASG